VKLVTSSILSSELELLGILIESSNVEEISDFSFDSSIPSEPASVIKLDNSTLSLLTCILISSFAHIPSALIQTTLYSNLSKINFSLDDNSINYQLIVALTGTLLILDCSFTPTSTVTFSSSCFLPFSQSLPLSIQHLSLANLSFDLSPCFTVSEREILTVPTKEENIQQKMLNLTTVNLSPFHTTTP
jgi:hypothetical protein